MAKKTQVKAKKSVGIHEFVRDLKGGENCSPLQGSLFPVLRHNFHAISQFELIGYTNEVKNEIEILSKALSESIYWDEIVGDINKLTPHELIERLYNLAYKCSSISGAEPYINNEKLIFAIVESCDEGFITDMQMLDDFMKRYPIHKKAMTNILRVLYKHGVLICDGYYFEAELSSLVESITPLEYIKNQEKKEQSELLEERKEQIDLFKKCKKEHEKDYKKTLKFKYEPDISYLKTHLYEIETKFKGELSELQANFICLIKDTIRLSEINEGFQDFSDEYYINEDREPCNIRDLFMINYSEHSLESLIVSNIDDNIGNYGFPSFFIEREISEQNVNEVIPNSYFPNLIINIFRNLWQIINLI